MIKEAIARKINILEKVVTTNATPPADSMDRTIPTRKNITDNNVNKFILRSLNFIIIHHSHVFFDFIIRLTISKMKNMIPIMMARAEMIFKTYTVPAAATFKSITMTSARIPIARNIAACRSILSSLLILMSV